MTMKKLGFASLVVAMALSMTACNTVKGIGKDLQEGGEAIEKAADDTGGTDDD